MTAVLLGLLFGAAAACAAAEAAVGGAHRVAALGRAADAVRVAAAVVCVYEGRAGAGVARGAGGWLAEHAGGRFARRQAAVGLR